MDHHNSEHFYWPDRHFIRNALIFYGDTVLGSSGMFFHRNI